MDRRSIIKVMSTRGCYFSFVLILPILALVAACSATSTPTFPDQSSVSFSVTDLRAGNGAQAATGSTLTVTYEGWLYSATATDNKGALFDSNVGGTPLTFLLGAGQVIPGWDQGLVGLKVGGVRRLVIPPSLAYGPIGNAVVPPNAALVFEVELLALQ